MVRNVTLGSCSMCARIGSILAPFVRELGKATYPAVPNVLYCLLAVTSSLLALLLPETKGQNMPDTFLESENFESKSTNENGTLKSSAEVKTESSNLDEEMKKNYEALDQ
ncbi:hypothetical protein CEXT_463911 [Caerostris extrusa]|uniref:Uncharacterized protein n=1 Tax=Caerostris extrusa TaxID=172846 RepID=A0AAV4X975_CAEEX|nr:hypothetical protein CEXT_463911 [Caerostris extrusa]